MKNATTHPERLAHLAAWLTSAAGEGHTTADRVNVPALCRAAGVVPARWNLWRNPSQRHQLTADEYLRLLPWLRVWYAYDAPPDADVDSRIL